MRALIRAMWQDEEGALLTIEWVFLATLLIIGIVVGLVAVRNAANSELAGFGVSLTSLDQSFYFMGTKLWDAWTGGSAANDVNDTNSEQLYNHRVVVPRLLEDSAGE
jgi:Flp pilus assembly pilin Flp